MYILKLFFTTQWSQSQLCLKLEAGVRTDLINVYFLSFFHSQILPWTCFSFPDVLFYYPRRSLSHHHTFRLTLSFLQSSLFISTPLHSFVFHLLWPEEICLRFPFSDVIYSDLSTVLFSSRPLCSSFGIFAPNVEDFSRL